MTLDSTRTEYGRVRPSVVALDSPVRSRATVTTDGPDRLGRQGVTHAVQPSPFEARAIDVLGADVSAAVQDRVARLAESVLRFAVCNARNGYVDACAGADPASMAQPDTASASMPRDPIFDVTLQRQYFRICPHALRREVSLIVGRDQTRQVDALMRVLQDVQRDDVDSALRHNLPASSSCMDGAPSSWPKSGLVSAITLLSMRQAQLQGVDLRGVRLVGIDFSDATLERADLSQDPSATPTIHLQACNFSSVRAAQVTLAHVSMKDCVWRDSDLTDAVAHHVTAQACDFSGTDMGGANFQFARVSTSDFSYLRGHKFDLRYAVATHNNFSGAALIYSLISDGTLTDSRFALADLRYADLHRTDLRRNVFDHAKLAYCNLQATDLRGGSLRDASLVGANVSHSDLTDVPIDYQKVAGANFEGSTLPDLGPDIMDYARDARGNFILRPGLLPAALDEQVQKQLDARWRATHPSEADSEDETDVATSSYTALEPTDADAEPSHLQKWNAFFCATLVLSSSGQMPMAPPRQAGGSPPDRTDNTIQLPI